MDGRLGKGGDTARMVVAHSLFFGAKRSRCEQEMHLPAVAGGGAAIAAKPGRYRGPCVRCCPAREHRKRSPTGRRRERRSASRRNPSRYSHDPARRPCWQDPMFRDPHSNKPRPRRCIRPGGDIAQIKSQDGIPKKHRHHLGTGIDNRGRWHADKDHERGRRHHCPREDAVTVFEELGDVRTAKCFPSREYGTMPISGSVL